MAYGCRRVISTTQMPCQDQAVLVVGDLDGAEGLLEERLLLLWGALFYVLAGAEGGEGAGGVVGGDGTDGGGEAGLQDGGGSFEAAQLLGEGGGGLGALDADEVGDLRDLAAGAGEICADGGGVGEALGLGGGAVSVDDLAAAADGILLISQGVQGGPHGGLQGLQAGRLDAMPAAGVIALHGTVAGLPAVLQGHQAAAYAAADEAGERVDRAGTPQAGLVGVLLPHPGDALPFLRGEDGGDAAGDPHGLRGGDLRAFICADFADIDARVDFIFEEIIEVGFLPGRGALEESGGGAVEVVEDAGVALPGEVHLEDPADDGGGDGIQLEAAILADAVAQGDVTAQIPAVPGEVLVGHHHAVGVLLTLQLCEAGQHVQHHAARGGGGVDGLGGGDQGDAQGLEIVLDDGEGIPEGTAQAVQLVDHHHGDLTGADVGQEALKGGAGGVLAGEAGILIEADRPGLGHGRPGFEDAPLGVAADAVLGLLLGADANVARGDSVFVHDKNTSLRILFYDLAVFTGSDLNVNN